MQTQIALPVHHRERKSPVENVANGFISPQTAVLSDPQPVTRPKHPPSYDSVTRSTLHHSSAAFHSSPKKRTSQETAAKHATRDGDEGVPQQPLKFSGKRPNSQHGSHTVTEPSLHPRRVVHPSPQSDSSDSESHSVERKPATRSSCWQEIRIKDEYDRKNFGERSAAA